MEEVNYNETVVIPFLEKKCKDLLSLNLILEAKLLIEQNKVKNFESKTTDEKIKLQDLTKQLEILKIELNTIQNEKNNIEIEKNTLGGELNIKEIALIREISIKDSILNEYNQLKTQFDSLTLEFNTLKQSINNKKVKEPKLV